MLDYKELTAIAFAHAVTSSIADSAGCPFEVFRNAYLRAIDAMSPPERNVDLMDIYDLYHENRSKEKQPITRIIIELSGVEGDILKGYTEDVKDMNQVARFAACNPNAKIRIERIGNNRPKEGQS